jgi:hypothetical protein
MMMKASEERDDRYCGEGDGEGSKSVSIGSSLRTIGVWDKNRQVVSERFGWVCGVERRIVGDGTVRTSRTCSITTTGKVGSTMVETAWEALEVESRLV